MSKNEIQSIPNKDVTLSSKLHTWRTPDVIFKPLHDRFNFTIDLAADKENTLLPKFFGEEEDSLKQNWEGHTGWCNPPYGRQIPKWTKKCLNTKVQPGNAIVILLPARPDTSWWHDVKDNCITVFLRRRIPFTEPSKQETVGAPFPSMLLVFLNEQDLNGKKNGDIFTWDWKMGENFPL